MTTSKNYTCNGEILQFMTTQFQYCIHIILKVLYVVNNYYVVLS